MNQLNAIKEQFLSRQKKISKRIVLCAGTGCVANGALKLHEAFLKRSKDENLSIVLDLKFEPKNQATHLVHSGCQGFCQMGPLVSIFPDNILYTKVQLSDVNEIIERSIKNNEVIERLLVQDPKTLEHFKGAETIPFYTKQNRLVLKNCGLVDATDIEDYIARDGYMSADKAYTKMDSQKICDEVLASGLRGRGGGGFPTGRKWTLTRQSISKKKYVICNGDEGDPGAFMDRSVMEGNPHAVIEGMMIAARAIGADEGYVYVRTEYPLAVQRMRFAVEEAYRLGILGKHVLGTKFCFDLQVMEGAGAFVCGEETALMASIEGKRGMPAPKPPFPAQKGLFAQPTVINNVETLATIPFIIREGAAAFKKLGTDHSPGTKTFALTGHVMNTGLIEVPFGTTLRDIVMEIGGGVMDSNGKPSKIGFKSVQIGGPSGGCLTQEHLELPLDFDSLKTVGAMVGSGGLVVMNQDTCMVSMARFFMQFTQHESCGKCVLCREGTRQMLALLDEIIEGQATDKTLTLLEQLAKAVQKGSLCGLGKTAPNPVLSTLHYFRDEYEAHVFQKMCPSKQCKALSSPEIDPALCKGCTACKRKCPVNAIQGELKQPHHIRIEVCIKCGACKSACKFGAIKGV